MDKRLLDYAEMYREVNNGTASCKKCNDNTVVARGCINDDYCLPTPYNMNGGILTMAFVDMQPLESVYPPETAFCNGTLFPNLNKPFYGGMRR